MMTYIGCEEARGRGGGTSEGGGGGREREASGGVGEIPSAYQSVYSALRVPPPWEGWGGRGGAKSKRGKDDIRMEGKDLRVRLIIERLSLLSPPPSPTRPDKKKLNKTYLQSLENNKFVKPSLAATARRRSLRVVLCCEGGL